MINALQNNVEQEQNRTRAATLYAEVMNQETGMVSIDNLFSICRAAGFNTYKQDGFESCKQFINSLVELEENSLGGFCPGLDENGKNPNALKTITDQTRIGDYCSSTNIYAGEVVFKKQYNCTCMASACNEGYEFKGGRCEIIVADGQGFCLRSENKIKKDMTLEESVTFCQNLASKNKCKYKTVVIQHKDLNVICNATTDEVNNVLQTNAERKRLQQERQIAALKYYQVCGKDKGKTGKTEYCVQDMFNWTNTQIGQALEFAKDYAKLKHNNTIYCNKQHRSSDNDDYIACSTLDGKILYEFKFDDVLESIDNDRRRSERKALCALYGGSISFDNDVCKNIGAAKCSTMSKSIIKYGHQTKWTDDKCYFTDYGHKSMSEDEFEKSLAKIANLDNKAFYKVQGIAVRKNFNLEDEIKKYINGQLGGKQTITCDAGYKTIKVGLFQSDDVKRCYVNKKPIDFVFDDLSELFKRVRDAGESGVKCISNNGKFDGHYCRGLTKSECFQLEKLMLKELKTHGWAGDDDLVDWDEAAGACELNAAQFSNNVDKVGKYAAIAGLTIGGVFTGGTTTAAAISLMSVELAGMAGEIYTERKKELLPQEWATKFLTASRVCKQPTCAETTLRQNMGKISQASDMLNRDVLSQVDSELARLAELLPEERLVKVMSDPQYPNCWETWECQEKIFILMQMSSLAVGVGKALVKLPKVLSKKMAQAAAKSANAPKAVISYTKELEALGIKHSVVGGKDVYTDIKTGKQLSDVQVLNRIPTSMNDDFARIGVRQIEQSDGSVRYLDIRPGGGNKFISETEVLKRIDELPSTAGKSANAAGKAGESANAAGKAGESANAAGKAGESANAAGKAGESANAAGKAGESANAAGKAGESANAADKAGQSANAAGKAGQSANAAGKAEKTADNVGDAARTSANAGKVANNAEKIAAARKADNLGFHGTDADIALTDKIRASANTSEKLGNVGYGIAREYDAAETYAIRRLIERQYKGAVDFYRENGVLIVQPKNGPLNLNNKTCYIYTTAKNPSEPWETLSNLSAGSFNAARMPEAVEILDKTAINLDDLISAGKVKIVY